MNVKFSNVLSNSTQDWFESQTGSVSHVTYVNRRNQQADAFERTEGSLTCACQVVPGPQQSLLEAEKIDLAAHKWQPLINEHPSWKVRLCVP